MPIQTNFELGLNGLYANNINIQFLTIDFHTYTLIFIL